MNAGRGEEASEEKSEASRDWFVKFKERSCLYDMKAETEEASIDREAAASYPEDVAKIINRLPM